jgi:hypothetical protein
MATMIYNKKGVFLTFISIAIVAAVMIIFTPSNVSLEKDITSIKSRVSKVNDYVFDLEKVYLDNTLKATGRRTIIALIKHMNANSAFLSNFEDSFSEVIMDGTIEGVNIDNSYPETIMTGNTFKNFVNSITAQAENTFNVQTVFDPIHKDNITITQTLPWFVDVEAKVVFSVLTDEGTASWKKNVTIKTQISVENFEDPNYLVKTSGSFVNKIKKTDTLFNEWDVETVKDHIRDGTYVHFEESKAPNFIMRFTEDMSESPCCGIESLIDPNHASINDKDVSYSDYLYWTMADDCDSNTLYQDVSPGGINSEFSHIKFDFGHIALFNLLNDPQADIIQVCPP